MNTIAKIISALRFVANHPLNRGRKWQAMFEFFTAQIALKLLPGDFCMEFPNRTHIMLAPSMKGAWHFITPRLFDFEEMSFVMHYLRVGDFFADVGANVGVYTVLAAGVAGARAAAFEPSRDSFEMLLRNIRINALTNRVQAFEIAVGGQLGTMRLTVGQGTENYIASQSSEGASVPVKVTILDHEFSDNPPNLLKIDVEGFECEVIAGAKKTLRRPELRAMIVERCGNGTRYGFDEDALHREIRQEGFLPCTYNPFTRLLRQAPDTTVGNVIYVRDLNGANAILKSASAFQFGSYSI
jgi:FkbM family methyltransferase